MDPEIDSLWALVAGVLLLLSNVGAIVMLEGLTRRRSVLTISARHLAGASGAVVGVISVSLLEIDILQSPILEGTSAAGDALRNPFANVWISGCSAVLLTTLSMAGMAERATVFAHLLGGLLIGGLLAPLAASARGVDGFLTTIEFGDHTYLDTAAGSMFAVAGWVALIGAMIIGPRRGRSSTSGSIREVVGESTPVAMVGALLMYSTLFGVLARPGDGWNDTVASGAFVMLMGGAVGVLSGMAIGRVLVGHVRAVHVLRGLLAGVVSTTGSPLEATLEEAVIFGLVGSSLALAVGYYLDSRNVDDPVAIISVFGAAGVWGSLAIGVTNGEQFLAQLVGVAITGAIATTAAGFLFAVLRLLHVFRVRPDVEVAGLEL